MQPNCSALATWTIVAASESIASCHRVTCEVLLPPPVFTVLEPCFLRFPLLMRRYSYHEVNMEILIMRQTNEVCRTARFAKTLLRGQFRKLSFLPRWLDGL